MAFRRAVAALFVLAVLLALAAGVLTYEHILRDERRWCAVLHYPASPAQARDFHRLAGEFGCR